jgi:putative DNA primase/helicase
MADLSNILGGPWSPPSKIEPEPPEIQLINAMQAAGLTPPPQVHLDGKLHRFASGTKGQPGKGDKSGWYICFSDGIPAGRFGCWRAGIETTFRADVGRTLTDAEQMLHARRLSEAVRLRDAELKRQREIAADTVESIWSAGMLAEANHPYLERKKIDVHGARMTGDGRLMVPLYSPDGQLSSLQYISNDGSKLYHSGGQTGGCFWMVGTMDEPGILYVAEGFATAATIHEVMGRPCIVAYSASNLVPVTGHMRERYGASQQIVIVADNDASGTGQKYADQASAKYGARAITIPVPGDANDYVNEGHDLKILLQPPVTDWVDNADDISIRPSPIKWLVKHWLQDRAMIMVHGPSGGGKTFAVLDWCLHICSGKPDWMGHKVTPGTVLYLAGEGHHGIRGRIAAWKQHNGVDRIGRLWVSRSGCDLNTAEGYSRVVDAVRALPESPKAIVVDTLHRFLNGDENSAQDAKTMIDACNALMMEFDCSVILVHHTGVSEEAQHRARGSSAWKGALEIEISIVPAKGDSPMQIVQRKSKDAEEAKPVYASLEVVKIDGWFDDDGDPVGSAVLVQAEPPEETKKDSKLSQNRKMFENAWFASGADMADGLPYVTKSALANYLQHDRGMKEASIKQNLKPSDNTRLIGSLINANIIEIYEHGFRVICPEMASGMALGRDMG